MYLDKEFISEESLLSASSTTKTWDLFCAQAKIGQGGMLAHCSLNAHSFTFQKWPKIMP